MENQVPDNLPKLNEKLINISQLKNSGGIFGFLDIFKKNKLYLFIVVGIIIGASVLYYLYIKNKEKKKAKLEEKDKNNMLDIININDQTNDKLLYNPIDKLYYSLDSSGNPIKTTIEIYKNKNKNLQQMEQQQLAQRKMEQQQLAQRQMEQQHLAQRQMEQIAQKQMSKTKLKHQVEHVSESDEETSDNIVYDVNEIDNDLNISQYNLNSDDMNEINSKLSEK